MENQEIIKLQGIEGTKEYFQNLYEKGKIFIFKYRKVYQLRHSSKRVYKNEFYLLEFEQMRIQVGKTPYTKRGRFVAFNSVEANNLVGREIFLSH